MSGSKLVISLPILVEGRYDKIKLETVLQGNIITTDGFGVFNSTQKTSMIKRIAEKHGIIVLTDSDGAGLVIRNYINSVLPGDKIIHLYTPQIEGKEKRKATPSKEGFLGVEGMEQQLLYDMFLPFADKENFKQRNEITKQDFYNDGLSGGANSALLRGELIKICNLPRNLSANALLRALNLLYTKEEYQEKLGEINHCQQ